MHSVSSGLSRLYLHDSGLTRVVRSESALVLQFDWAKLETFPEGDVPETIILGVCELRLRDIKSELFTLWDQQSVEVLKQAAPPEDYAIGLMVVGDNAFDDLNHRSTIEGLYENAGEYYWSKWELEYGQATLSWNSHVTYDQWQAGALP